jgi:PAS domain S-box-containing protein
MPEDISKSAAEITLPTSDLYRVQVRELREYAMFTLDPRGVLTSWNAGVERLLGYSEEEWIDSTPV